MASKRELQNLSGRQVPKSKHSKLDRFKIVNQFCHWAVTLTQGWDVEAWSEICLGSLWLAMFPSPTWCASCTFNCSSCRQQNHNIPQGDLFDVPSTLMWLWEVTLCRLTLCWQHWRGAFLKVRCHFVQRIPSFFFFFMLSLVQFSFATPTEFGNTTESPCALFVNFLVVSGFMRWTSADHGGGHTQCQDC